MGKDPPHVGTVDSLEEFRHSAAITTFWTTRHTAEREGTDSPQRPPRPPRNTPRSRPGAHRAPVPRTLPTRPPGSAAREGTDSPQRPPRPPRKTPRRRPGANWAPVPRTLPTRPPGSGPISAVSAVNLGSPSRRSPRSGPWDHGGDRRDVSEFPRPRLSAARGTRRRESPPQIPE